MEPDYSGYLSLLGGEGSRCSSFLAVILLKGWIIGDSPNGLWTLLPIFGIRNDPPSPIYIWNFSENPFNFEETGVPKRQMSRSQSITVKEEKEGPPMVSLNEVSSSRPCGSPLMVASLLLKLSPPFWCLFQERENSPLGTSSEMAQTTQSQPIRSRFVSFYWAFSYSRKHRFRSSLGLWCAIKRLQPPTVFPLSSTPQCHNSPSTLL